MEQAKMDRISELTRISRERELTPAEQEERCALREQYLQEWRNSTRSALENTCLVDEEGNKRKLRKKGED